MTGGGAAVSRTRTIVLWCPGWSVAALVRAGGAREDAPVALVERGRVAACSARAHASGVLPGLRPREAQARCVGLVLAPVDRDRDRRFFEPVLRAVGEDVPGVRLLRPGLCGVRARGPARFYGGEERAAALLVERVARCGATARAGVADTPFAAEQAARRAAGPDGVLVVAEGTARGFLAPLPVEALGGVPPPAVLRRLGVRTLGGFAALDPRSVRDRFGAEGARARALAAAEDGEIVVGSPPSDELGVSETFETPVERADQVAFAFRTRAEDLVAGLARRGLVCAAVRVTVRDDRGGVSERTWRHPSRFTAAGVLDRVRWQLESARPGLAAGVVAVEAEPVGLDEAAHHEAGLWGEGPDERIPHALARMQGTLGRAAVLGARLGGGRTLAERVVLTPWGEPPDEGRVRDRLLPWPGAPPAPAPATVFSPPVEVAVLDGDGARIRTDARGGLVGDPAWFTGPAGKPSGPVTAWSGAWPVRERWWDPDRARSFHRLQLIAEGGAWLLLHEEGRWRAEGRYD